MALKNTVVIVAPVDDPHACVVAKRLEALDAQAIVLDTAEFPSRWSLSVELADDSRFRFALGRDEIELHQDSVAGVWWRRPKRYVPSADVDEPHLRRFVTYEAQAAFEDWLHCLGTRVINPLAADKAASHKLLQLRLAREVGLKIPRSLATNSPRHAASFCEHPEDKVVYKPFTAPNWQLVPTQRLSKDAANHFSTVAYAPVIFQEEIVKVGDIRATVLDNQIFCVEIGSSSDETPLDWRIDPSRQYAPHELPESVKVELVELLRRLGLRFAACDLALTQDGEYVFFEANTGGQWLFAEIMVDQPISWAFARSLLGETNSQDATR